MPQPYKVPSAWGFETMMPAISGNVGRHREVGKGRWRLEEHVLLLKYIEMLYSNQTELI